MQIIEKAGCRVAVMDHLVTPETGRPIEVEIHSSEQESSMQAAGALGERLADTLLQAFLKDKHQPDTRGDLHTI